MAKHRRRGQFQAATGTAMYWHREAFNCTIEATAEATNCSARHAQTFLSRHQRKLDLVGERIRLNPFGELCVEGRKEKGAEAPLIPIAGLL